MQKVSPWYLLFMAALVVGSVAKFRNSGKTVMLMSIAVSDGLYSWLDRMRQRKWFVLYALAVALFFGSLYYTADSIFFLHSAHAGHRLKSAGIDGALCSFIMRLAAYWSPVPKRKTLSATI